MKTNLIKIVILSVAVMVGSCHKTMDMDEIQIMGIPTGLLSTVELADPVNPANPNNQFDSIGVWHNDMLDFIFNNPGNSGTHGEISHQLNVYAMQRWGHPNTQIEVPVIQWQEADGIEELQNRIVSDSPLSDRGKEQLLVLLEMVAGHSLSVEEFSYPDLKESIVALEQQWEYEEALPLMDTNILQMAASVARHSVYYWTGNGTKLPIESFPGEEGSSGSTERIMFKNVVRFIATAQWDMGGFISGYVGGSLKDAAGKAAGSSAWIKGFFNYGVPDGW